MTLSHDNYESAAKKIIERVGKKVVIGAPLGIGKPIGLLNALYRLAVSDASIDLTIITALTLARPEYSNELEERLVAPLLDRMLTNYEDPLYEAARMAQQLPKNIRVIEFFLTTGKYLHNDYAQRNYISSTYSLAARDALRNGVNVFAQQVARSATDANKFSVSSNSDIFSSVIESLNAYAARGEKIAIVAEVNDNMPYMYGTDAVFATEIFTDIVDTKNYHSLFAIPHDELSAADHLIGFYTSFLVKDDSCLQIGIGKLSNAVANALIVRDKNPDVYQYVFKQLGVREKFNDIITEIGEQSPFVKGLYASTEMLSDAYIELYNAGILRKRVYDHFGLQRLLNEQKISETIAPDMLDVLIANKIINPRLDADDVEFLTTFGIFNPDVQFQNDELILTSGLRISADLRDSNARAVVVKNCLGKCLKTGKIIHAGFFLGTNELYQQLRDLPEEVRLQIDMTSIARTNALHWNYDLLEQQRWNARFVNTAMMVTLGGVVISDGLKDMREVSGVGGQFDFINMAQSLATTRSIINCHSTRTEKRGVMSNIIWEYANYTVPRFLRDMVVTEYGIADCRGKTDAGIIKAMLNISDSRFQEELLQQAKRAGKIESDYQIPALFRQNFPENVKSIVRELQQKGLCEPYPFGTELTAEEQVIKKALLVLKVCTTWQTIRLVIRSLFLFKSDEDFSAYLTRMKLLHPKNFKEFIYKKLLKLVIYRLPKSPAQKSINSR
jgi:acyl-CoA hydrolase